MRTLHLKQFFWLSVSFIIIISDQVSKAIAVNELSDVGTVKLLPFFSLTLAYNTGAAFSFLRDAGGWQHIFFLSIAFVVSVILLFWLLRLDPTKKLEATAIALILGGAWGNVYDRLTLGKVIDFLHFHVGEWSWPIFNIADSAITVGVGLLIIDLVRSKANK